MNYGHPCDEVSAPYIGRCEYNTAYEVLEHIYGNLEVIRHYVLHDMI